MATDPSLTGGPTDPTGTPTMAVAGARIPSPGPAPTPTDPGGAPKGSPKDVPVSSTNLETLLSAYVGQLYENLRTAELSDGKTFDHYLQKDNNEGPILKSLWQNNIDGREIDPDGHEIAVGMLYDDLDAIKEFVADDIQRQADLEASDDFKKAMHQNVEGAAEVISQIDRNYETSRDELARIVNEKIVKIEAIFDEQFEKDADGNFLPVIKKDEDGEDVYDTAGDPVVIADGEKIKELRDNAIQQARDYLKEQQTILAKLHNQRKEQLYHSYQEAERIALARRAHELNLAYENWEQVENLSHPSDCAHQKYQDWQNRFAEWSNNPKNKDPLNQKLHLEQGGKTIEMMTSIKKSDSGGFSMEVNFPAGTKSKTKIAAFENFALEATAHGLDEFNLSDCKLSPEKTFELAKKIKAINPDAKIGGLTRDIQMKFNKIDHSEWVKAHQEYRKKQLGLSDDGPQPLPEFEKIEAKGATRTPVTPVGGARVCKSPTPPPPRPAAAAAPPPRPTERPRTDPTFIATTKIRPGG